MFYFRVITGGLQEFSYRIMRCSTDPYLILENPLIGLFWDGIKSKFYFFEKMANIRVIVGLLQEFSNRIM